jgi:hypothetical protein
MGDRYDRDRAARRKRFGSAIPPEPILTWGIGDVSKLGHNGGPPLDEEPGYLWRKYRWTKAYKEAWKTPSMAVLKFRVARAEAAGLSYHDYMLELLDTGRHLQKADVDRRVRAVAKPTPMGGPPPAAPRAPASPMVALASDRQIGDSKPEVGPTPPARSIGQRQHTAPSNRPMPQPLDVPKRK